MEFCVVEELKILYKCLCRRRVKGSFFIKIVFFKLKIAGLLILCDITYADPNYNCLSLELTHHDDKSIYLNVEFHQIVFYLFQ